MEKARVKHKGGGVWGMGNPLTSENTRIGRVNKQRFRDSYVYHFWEGNTPFGEAHENEAKVLSEKAFPWALNTDKLNSDTIS
jgi:hypothetical protein